MNASSEESTLLSRGIKPTPNRILIVRELLRATHPVSLGDIEALTGYSIDKASIFRVLELFAEKELTHVIEDGSRSLKYELCHSSGHHRASDQHAHFYCENCGSVTCLDEVSLPEIAVPAQYRVKSVNLMFKGLWPDCSE
ncbi:MAG: transcriptional repressor [Muribaculaceae bacterium]|nr:transcriptional repressor [Muribaculaceae bacterium]